MINGYAHRTSPAIAVVACVGAIALAGCGSSSSSSTSSSSSKSAAAASAASSSTAAAANNGGVTAPAAGASTSSSASATATANPAAQAYALSLVPLAEAWQAAAQHYDNLVGGGGTNLTLIATASHTFAAATNKFANGIAALTPPAGAAGAQAALVAAVRALGGDVTELQAAATNKDPSAASDAQRRVGPDGKAVSDAVVALAKAAQQGG